MFTISRLLRTDDQGVTLEEDERRRQSRRIEKKNMAEKLLKKMPPRTVKCVQLIRAMNFEDILKYKK